MAVGGIGILALIVLPWVLLSSSPADNSAVTLGYLQLLVINPLVFVLGGIYAWVKQRPSFPWIIAIYSVGFAGSLFVVFNSTAWVYLPIYLLLVLGAILLDKGFDNLFRWFRTRRGKKKQKPQEEAGSQ